MLLGEVQLDHKVDPTALPLRIRYQSQEQHISTIFHRWQWLKNRNSKWQVWSVTWVINTQYFIKDFSFFFISYLSFIFCTLSLGFSAFCVSSTPFFTICTAYWLLFFSYPRALLSIHFWFSSWPVVFLFFFLFFFLVISLPSFFLSTFLFHCFCSTFLFFSLFLFLVIFSSFLLLLFYALQSGFGSLILSHSVPCLLFLTVICLHSPVMCWTDFTILNSFMWQYPDCGSLFTVITYNWPTIVLF